MSPSAQETSAEDNYLSKMLGQAAPKPSAAEEKAKILATVFGKKTSIVFDSKAICDLFQKEGQAEKSKEILAHLLFVQLFLVKSNMGLQVNSRFIFQKYWEHSQSVLTLTKLNEMI